MKRAVDTTSHNEFVKRVKENIGMTINGEAPKILKPPLATEWVLAPQEYVPKLKNHIEAKSKKNSIDSSILKAFNFEKLKLINKNCNYLTDFIEEICKRDSIDNYRF